MSTALAGPIRVYERPARRWVGSFLVVTSIFLIAGTGIRTWKQELPSPAKSVAAIMVEYAPTVTVARSPERPSPSGPEQEEIPAPNPVAPEPVEAPPPSDSPIQKATTQESVTPLTTLPESEPDVGNEAVPDETQAAPAAQHSTSPAPVEAPTGDKSAAPLTGMPTVATSFDPSLWLTAVREHVESHRHGFRQGRRPRPQHSIALVRFKMDRSGNLLSSSLEESTGSKMLDEEALDLINRSQPFPPLPLEITADTVEITIPVEFFIY